MITDDPMTRVLSAPFIVSLNRVGHCHIAYVDLKAIREELTASGFVEADDGRILYQFWLPLYDWDAALGAVRLVKGADWFAPDCRVQGCRHWEVRAFKLGRWER